MPKKLNKNGACATTASNANEDETSTVIPQGRGKADRVQRLRSQVWFCLVCAQKQAPWDDPAAMDKFFLKRSHGPFRMFERIRDNCSSPGLKNRTLKGRSVVEVVAEKQGYHHTQAAFESSLWSLLSGSAWSPVKREEEIDRLLRTLALYESGPTDRFIRTALSAPDFRGLKRNRAYFQRVLGQLARKRSLDNILLLCLLYRRYLEIGRLGEARDVRAAVLRAIHRYCDRPGFSRDVHTIWVFITRRRVFAGQPSLEHTPRALSEARERIGVWEAQCTPAKAWQRLDDQSWLYACIGENAEEIPVSYIIPRNPGVERFIAARDEFMTRELIVAKIYRRKHEHREPWRPGDKDVPDPGASS